MNIIKKIYPDISENKLKELKYDTEGLYSITMPDEAKIISELILKNIDKNNIIMDCTAGLGGNSLSFCKYFKKVIAYEINKERYDILCNNIVLYEHTNISIYNDNCIENLNKHICDVYFFDPPWGGPDYKKEQNLSLTLSNKSLNDIVKYIFNININATVCFKLPYNYNFNEFNNMKYYKKKLKIWLLF